MVYLCALIYYKPKSKKMTDAQSNTLSMSKAVQELLEASTVIVQSIPAFNSTKNELDSTLAVIDEAARLQARKITGNAEDKEEAALKAIDAIIAITGPAKSYAKTIGNNTLYRAVSYNRSDFRRTRQTDTINTFIVIRDIIQANAAALEEYGIHAERINELSELIDAYSNLVTAPRNAIASRSVATKTLAVSFEELKSIIQRLDGFVEVKKKENIAFYNAYKSARIIINNRGRNKKHSETSTDAIKKAMPTGRQAA
jgi:hypothetical protein